MLPPTLTKTMASLPGGVVVVVAGEVVVVRGAAVVGAAVPDPPLEQLAANSAAAARAQAIVVPRRGDIVPTSVGNPSKAGVNARSGARLAGHGILAGVTDRGEVIARGRDTEIVDHGPGLVLRRPIVPRSLAAEADVMRWVRAQGYPCPEVTEVVDDGLVMERIEGVSMLDDLVRRPGRLRRYATLLADLHGWLHRLTPLATSDEGPTLPELPKWFGEGSDLVHGDLHPGNVLLTDEGPVVIDWSNASIGPGGADVATAWLLLACGEPEAGKVERLLVAGFRGVFLRSFLRATDRDAAAHCLRVVLERRRGDLHLSASELASMAQVVDRFAR
jgi:tRNA A-37 threonylcarbamoyl transferase component Bud32